MRARRLWRDGLRDRNGNVAVVFALGAPVLIGAAALGVETSFDYYRHTHLQVAADAAAYAAAQESRAGSAYAQVRTAAVDAAVSNSWVAAAGDIQVNSPPTSGANVSPSAVEVVLTETVPRFFSAYFTQTPLIVRARAVALYQNAGNACVLALNKTASQALQVQGSSSLTLNGCNVMANSVANDAVKLWGSSQMTADCLGSAGGVANNGSLTLTQCSAPLANAPRAKDPFASLAEPSRGPTRHVGNGSGTTVLEPGYYPAGIHVTGSAIMNPGTYYVAGQGFRLNGNAQVSGDGVTIFLAPGAEVSMNGAANVNLTAPTSGAHAGILFFGDRNSTGGSNVFNGDAGSSLTGHIYFPTQSVSYLGNFSGVNGCMNIVADTVEWSGSATMSVDCTSQGMAPVLAWQTVRLVE